MGALLRAPGSLLWAWRGRRHRPGDGTERGLELGGETRRHGQMGSVAGSRVVAARQQGGALLRKGDQGLGVPWRGWPGSVLKALGAGPPQVRSRRKKRIWSEALEGTRRRAAAGG